MIKNPKLELRRKFMRIAKLKSFLRWLMTPQNENEKQVFKEFGFIDDYIMIANKLDTMTEQEIIDEINKQLSPYKLQIDELQNRS